jgi:hypothetical protein
MAPALPKSKKNDQANNSTCVDEIGLKEQSPMEEDCIILD